MNDTEHGKDLHGTTVTDIDQQKTYRQLVPELVTTSEDRAL